MMTQRGDLICHNSNPELCQPLEAPQHSLTQNSTRSLAGSLPTPLLPVISS